MLFFGVLGNAFFGVGVAQRDKVSPLALVMFVFARYGPLSRAQNLKKKTPLV